MRAAQLALYLLLAGCAGSSRSGLDYAPRVHVVQAGETLAGIAWRYGLDYRDVARWNRLDNPDLILVGQRLLLSPSGTRAGAVQSTSAGAASRPASSPPAQPRAPVPAPPASPAPAWRWPTAGPVVERFGSSSGLATGIAIAGREGQAVEAAAGGRVVYAGSGLIGYGQLVIIRHNDTYLSAYGYNSRLLVEQDQNVASGQKIAEMGQSPGRQARLHFEIRRNGVPIDPLPFLPLR